MQSRVVPLASCEIRRDRELSAHRHTRAAEWSAEVGRSEGKTAAGRRRGLWGLLVRAIVATCSHIWTNF
jgi:hypothetical protein